jgi:hypothetical protein
VSPGASSVVRRVRAEVGQPLREQEPGAVQAPLHRLLRNPDHRRRLGVGEPLDADEVEHLPLVLREALDGSQHAAAVRGQAGGGTAGGRDPALRQRRSGGVFI